eukprot:Skav226743  [mRNA]  locus=scaffold5056:95891:99018:+ [translate_table: standard]
MERGGRRCPCQRCKETGRTALRTPALVARWKDREYEGEKWFRIAEYAILAPAAVAQRQSPRNTAILGDRIAVTWGNPYGRGAVTPEIAMRLRNMEEICSTCYSFAAILSDRSVVTWGQARTGGASNELTNVQQIFASRAAFAALQCDGTVVAWGDPQGGSETTFAVAPRLMLRECYRWLASARRVDALVLPRPCSVLMLRECCRCLASARRVDALVLPRPCNVLMLRECCRCLASSRHVDASVLPRSCSMLMLRECRRWFAGAQRVDGNDCRNVIKLGVPLQQWSAKVTAQLTRAWMLWVAW